MAVVNLTAYIPLNFVAVEGQFDKMVPDMEVHMNQRCVTEFFHVEQNGSSLMFVQHIWRSDSGGEHSELVSGVFQQW